MFIPAPKFFNQGVKDFIVAKIANVVCIVEVIDVTITS